MRGGININKETIILSMVKRTLTAFSANQLVTTDNIRAKQLCADLIAYKVLRALYDICKETEVEFTWDDCAGVMKTTPQLLAATVPVVLYTMESFVGSGGFNFNAEEVRLVDLIEEDEPGEVNGILRAVKLFSEDYGEFLIEFFFLNAEVELYNNTLNAGKTYSWKEYLAEIQENKSMWDILQNAFYDGLKRLDFRVGWLSEELDEVRFLHGPQPEESL